MRPAATVEPLLTRKQVAKLVGVCDETLNRWIRAGKLPVLRLGGADRIDPADLRLFFDRNRRCGGCGEICGDLLHNCTQLGATSSEVKSLKHRS